MMRKFIGLAAGVMLCLAVSNVHAQGRAKGGGNPNERGNAGAKSESGRTGTSEPNRSGGNSEARKPGGNAPGGNWAEAKPSAGNQHQHAEGATAVNHNSSKSGSGADGMPAGAAAAHRNSPTGTGGESAAAGAAAAKRNAPQTSGAEGAAAGAAAANRNAPQTSGAEGAAAGAAAANRNAPQASGAEGAAAGAAVANRNAPSTTGAEGAVVGAAAAGRHEPAMSGAAGYAEVRNSFNRHDLYGADWYGSHSGAWTATGWAANAAWTSPPWSGLAKHFGYGDNPPISYNYGSNVTCVNGNVLVDGENVGTAEEFSQQAADLAQAGTDAQLTEEDRWVPLGVFAMVRNEQQHPQLILQLAMNQHGNLRGNYTDETTDHTLPIQGGIDTKTQRAAWTVGSNTACVMEVGLSNLTQSEAPALLHKAGKTERWVLVRLHQPE